LTEYCDRQITNQTPFPVLPLGRLRHSTVDMNLNIVCAVRILKQTVSWVIYNDILYPTCVWTSLDQRQWQINIRSYSLISQLRALDDMFTPSSYFSVFIYSYDGRFVQSFRILRTGSMRSTTSIYSCRALIMNLEVDIRGMFSKLDLLS